MVGKEPDIGPTARAVAANIRDLREASKMNYTQLSEELQQLGRNINAVGVRRTESGERRVTPDDLSAFAIALNVSPASLLMPNLSTVAKDDLVYITGWLKPITASVIWRWLMAARPLVHGTGGTYIDRALPKWEKDRLLTAMDRLAEVTAEADAAAARAAEAAEAAAARELDGDY